MSGAYGLREIADFFKANKKALVELFGLKHGVPAYFSIRELVGRLDFESVSAAFESWGLQYVPLEKGDFVSIDGKSLRSTVENEFNGQQDFVMMVSAFAQKTGAVLSQTRFRHKKTSEIDQVKQLVDHFKQRGIVFTLDALHCQKKR